MLGFDDVMQVTARKQIRTVGQKLYVDAMRKNDIVFCISLPELVDVSCDGHGCRPEIQERQQDNLRPAVEAGETGILPGDLRRWTPTCGRYTMHSLIFLALGF